MPEEPLTPQSEETSAGSSLLPAFFYEDGHGWREAPEPLPEEEPVTLHLNGRELITMLASPGLRRELAVGFLYGEGILDRLGQLKSLEEDEAGVRIEADDVELGARLFERRILGSGCGKGVTFLSGLDAFAESGRPSVEELPRFPASTIFAAAAQVYGGGPLYRRTRGTHAAALFTVGGEALAFAEDIGRHNAVDKVVGRALLAGHGLRETFLVVTGRISSEMVSKTAKTPIPLIVSKSVPTAMAVRHAGRLRLGVVGRVRRGSLVAFTLPELIEAPRGVRADADTPGAEGAAVDAAAAGPGDAEGDRPGPGRDA